MSNLDLINSSDDNKINEMFDKHIKHCINEGLTFISGNFNTVDKKRQFLLIEEMHKLNMTKTCNMELFNEEYF